MSRLTMKLRGKNAYYIDGTNGNDTNTGRLGAAWKTLGKAVASAPAGCTVYVRAGTYNEQAKFTRALNLIGYPGETVIIDGTDLPMDTYTGLIDFKGTSGTHLSGVRISNLTIQNAMTPSGAGLVLCGVLARYVDNIQVDNITCENISDTGVFFRDSINCTAHHCTIEDCNNGASNMDEYLSMENCSYCYIYSNEVRRVHGATANPGGYESGICAKVYTHHVWIHDNYVHDNHGGGILIDAWDTPSNLPLDSVYVYNNKIVGTPSGISVDAEYGGYLQNVWVYNNLILRNYWAGIYLSEQTVDGQRKNVYIYNNTIAQAMDHGGAAIMVETPHIAGEIIIRNNCCYMRHTDGSNAYNGQIRILSSVLSGCTVDHNIVYGDNNYQTDETYNMPEADNAGEETWADPLFTSWAGDDYTLQAASPCRNAGVSWTGQPSTDYAGSPRSAGAAIDVGCYEYQE